MTRLLLLMGLLAGSWAAACAQPQVLTLTDLLDEVSRTHPIVRQANLLGPMARSELRMAQGAFDPKADLHYNRKRLWNYKDDWRPETYYENQDHYLKFPLPVGDLTTGYERFTGVNVNPENFTPPQGLYYAKLEVPLLRGTVLDDRRAVLLQARLLGQLNEAERVKLINKLLLEVAKDYWVWYEFWRNARIQSTGLQLADERLRFVRQQIATGERAPVDSIEAVLEVQKRELDTREAQMMLQNAALRLSVHLWGENGQPAELRDDVRPPLDLDRAPAGTQTLDSLATYASGSHPEVLKLQVKIAQLDIEKRWRRNELLPDLRFKYKYFFLPPTSDPKFFLEQPDYFGALYQRQNFQFGFDLTVPIFLRKERGKLELTRAKLEQSRLELDFARRHVVAEVQAAYNEMRAFDALIQTQRQTVANSVALLEAERVRFAAGESSLFVVNARERGLITARIKLVELEAKYNKSLAQFYWSSGLPYDSWQP